jgi:hypothetical protein
MLAHYGSTVVLRRFAPVIPMIVVAWLVTAPLVTAPGAVATSSLLALLALLTASARIVQANSKNAQPAASLAQARHDSDRTSSPAHGRRKR